ncbi:dnaJ homolog subfamily C member 9-like [Macrobrachium nipponense]|uniref:dnaJ homolog subfamily C member 9-like n=1 Tax=Macrobrachium nipponense TaxID=159736 RepID=UPI0030C88A46
MAPLLKVCKELFGTSNLFEVLDVDKDANENQLKKAYHKLSLKIHPDRVDDEEKEMATRKFQTLGKVYALLSDKDLRAVYIETGEVDDEATVTEDRDWDEYWRLMFKKIDIQDIKDFEAKYRESEEEMNDLKQAYLDGEGDMNYVLSEVLCCTYEDEGRFRGIIEEWIEKEEVPDFPNFSEEDKKKKNARKRKAAAEAKEAQQMKKELGLGDDMDSLKALIQKRNKGREEEMDSFLDNLAAKYGGGSGKKKGSKKGK